MGRFRDRRIREWSARGTGRTWRFAAAGRWCAGTSRSGDAGLVVVEGQPVARLARDGGLEAVVSLPENRVEGVRSALARVTLWSAPGVSFPAVLREVSRAADPLTRTYQARFALPGAGPG